MAQHKSAKKRIKQTETKRMANKVKTSRVRTAIKALRAAIESKDKAQAESLMTKTQCLLAKLAKSSAMTKATAARRTSNLATQVSKL